MAGNERKENYRRPYRNLRYKGRNENAAETAEEVKIPRRAAHIERTTSETDIQLSIDLDGSGESDIDTGIGFFDHMLKSFAKHGLFDLTLRVKGDLIVDCHHTIEDVGIVLGEAIIYQEDRILSLMRHSMQTVSAILIHRWSRSSFMQYLIQPE